MDDYCYDGQFSELSAYLHEISAKLDKIVDVLENERNRPKFNGISESSERKESREE